jgi:hypothetical protein
VKSLFRVVTRGKVSIVPTKTLIITHRITEVISVPTFLFDFGAGGCITIGIELAIGE